jgi:hypothetical protein
VVVVFTSSAACLGLQVAGAIVGPTWLVWGAIGLATFHRVLLTADSSGLHIVNRVRSLRVPWSGVDEVRWLVLPQAGMYGPEVKMPLIWIDGRKAPFWLPISDVTFARSAGVDADTVVAAVNSALRQIGVAVGPELPNIPWYMRSVFLLLTCLVGVIAGLAVVIYGCGY